MMSWLYDDSSLEQQPEWDAVLGDAYCHITEAYDSFGPESRQISQKLVSADILFAIYWCAAARAGLCANKTKPIIPQR